MNAYLMGINSSAGSSAGAAGVAEEGPAALEPPKVERRRDGSAFLRTVFILDRTFPSPFLSFSFGIDGPPCAGELMLAVVWWYCVVGLS